MTQIFAGYDGIGQYHRRRARAHFSAANDYLLIGSAGQPQVLRWQDGAVRSLDVQLGLRNMTHSEILWFG